MSSRSRMNAIQPALTLLLGLGLGITGATGTAAAGEGGISPQPAGYAAKRLPLPADILPSCMTVRPDGTLVVGSMDGDILLVVDTDRDGLPDAYRRWAGTLPHWPLGLLADGDDLLVATRGALLRLSDRDDDGWAERWTTLSDAWDVSRDHHDWTTGIARWPDGGWVVSPVTDDVRAKGVQGRHYLRGKAIKVGPGPETTVLAEGLRYPTGWATRRDGAVFFTDNQGQQKTTCEINLLVAGGWYGYPSQADPPNGPSTAIIPPVVRIPYPWARSVNGLAFAETGGRFGPLEGQLVLCEYNNRFILRASLEEVEGQVQGACYPFLENLLGPLCLAFALDGSLYVGSLREPAWGGEPEQGAIYRVSYAGRPAFGLKEVSAHSDGFTLTFFTPPEPGPAAEAPRYHVRRYRHVFRGSYHSPPTDEQGLTVTSAALRGESVRITLQEPLIPDRIYEIRVDLPGANPAMAHYTMNRVPKKIHHKDTENKDSATRDD
ncbi:MAG: sugar dehydrogenase [Isosphaeraceae bacterium]|nr:sugar dehydrogenase [Isosphaeraceae bacterium]